MKKPVMLMILDGWGLNEKKNEKNAIEAVHPKNFANYFNNYPHTILQASGEDVGLPDGQMGNSEVGHLNMGAGRIIYQPLVKITKEIESGNILKNEALSQIMKKVVAKESALHLMGLVSDGGIHSHIKHIFGLIDMAKKNGVTKLYIHGITDGRDTPPKSAIKYIEMLENKMQEVGLGKFATISGRFYTMDRDNRWERVEKSYKTIINLEGEKFTTAKDALEKSYSKDLTDEFVLPSLIEGYDGIKDSDGIIFFNFRPDRAREITRALNEENFSEFDVTNRPKTFYVCMTQYDEKFTLPIAYKAANVVNTIGEIVSKKGLNQLRIAETEKYAHVTFFLNGGVETKYKGEDRILIPSPKVATYDMQPEMNANIVTEKLIAALDEDKYDFIVINYANPDMIGHTGNYEAAKIAVEIIDTEFDKVVKKVLEKDGVVFVTADHGNVEKMENPETHIPWTAHTTNPVPFIVVSNSLKDIKLKDNGKLADIAPTILKVMNIEKPCEINGNELF